jgi:hypothetical protein
MNRFIDLTGKKFHRLTVIKRVEDYISPKGRRNPQWLCQCECGSPPKIVSGNSLKQGLIQSCGCLHKEVASNLGKSHARTNKYEFKTNYGIGYDYNNKEFYFDLEDYDLIKDKYWYVQKDGYVRYLQNGKKIYLHRLIMQCPSHLCIDHINHNPCDNRKNNLRLATKQQNNKNTSLKSNNTSGVIGVYWSKKDRKWQSSITVDYKVIRLGTFINKDDAIKARLQAEANYYGEFAPQKHLFEQYNIKYNNKEII